MNNINFSNPYLLLIGIPILLLIIIPFFILIKKEGFNFHNLGSLVIHIVIAILLTLSVAQMSYEKNIIETDVYVLADCSYSSNKNLDKIDEAIVRLSKNLPDNSKLGVIAYGKDCKIVTELGDKFSTVKDSEIDDSETNVRNALEYTSTLFANNVVKRIVVISDGVETKNTPISGLISNLEQQDIHIDAMYLDNTLTEDADEFQVSNVEFNESTFISKEEEAIVTIDSNKDVEAVKINLTVNGVVPADKASSYSFTSKLTKGSNKFSFELDTTIQGSATYVVTVSEYIDSEHTSKTDTNPYNNTYTFVQNVSKKIRVLFLSNDETNGESELASFKAVHADKDRYTIASYVNNDEDIPFTIDDLAVYDEIVLDNFNLESDTFKNNAESFINNVNTLVSTYGKSLITYGNVNTQNTNTSVPLKTLSNMLPLSYGASSEAKNYTIVLDISKSMLQASHLEIAKTAATRLLDTLSPNDFYNVIVFYGDCELIGSGRASEANIASTKKKIEEIEGKQSTNIQAALEYAYALLDGTNYKEKKVMLISDGESYISSSVSTKDLAEMFTNQRNKNVSTSCILINESSVEGESTSYPLVIKSLASAGGSVKRIVTIDEANGAAFDAIIDESSEIHKTGNFSVKVVNKKHEVLNGVTLSKNITEFYSSAKKESAESIINVIEKGVEYPLYSTWKYGEGNVSSYTSTLKSYASDTESSEAKFLENIVKTTTPKNIYKAPVNIEVSIAGSEVTINIATENITSLKDTEVNVVGTDFEQSYSLSLNSLYYYTSFNLDETGVYRFDITIGDSFVSKYFSISYYTEYDSFIESDISFLYNVITSDGTVNENLDLTIDNINVTMQRYKYNFTPLFMILSVILFVVDVIIRKLRLQDIKSLFKKGAKR